MDATTEYIRIPLPAKSATFSHKWLLFWIVGTVLIGKPFAYLHIGPMYITEITLAILIFNQRKSLTANDLFFFGIIGFFVSAGYIAHQTPIKIVGKDIAFMYFLLFLRFFPKDMPREYTKIIITSVYVAVGIYFMKPLFHIYLFQQKYRLSVMLLFVICLALSRPEKTKQKLLFFALLCALVANNKVLIIATVIVIFIKPLRKVIANAMTFKTLIFTCLSIILLSYFNGISFVLYTVIDFLNLIQNLSGSETQYQIGTSTWRLKIWVNAIQILFSKYQFLFGELPGHNFLSDEFLGGGVNLQGGEDLGIVRTAHNIVIQIMMKSGLVGLIAFFAYLIKWSEVKKMPLENKLYLALILLVSMATDVLEVPSRGPLFYCLTWVLYLEVSDARYISDTTNFAKKQTFNRAKKTFRSAA